LLHDQVSFHFVAVWSVGDPWSSWSRCYASHITNSAETGLWERRF